MKTQNVILSTFATLSVNSVKNLLRMQDISDKQRDPSSRIPQDDKGIFWRNRSGLTLIEVILSMGITVIIGVLLVVIIVNSTSLFTKQASNIQEGLNINDTLSNIRGNIKQASAVVVSYTSGGATYTTGASQLVLKVASIDSSGNILSNIFDYFIFYLDQKTIHLKIFPDPSSSRKSADRIFSTSVDNLKFQYLNSAAPPVEVVPINATKVRVSLALKQKVGLSFATSMATSEANLRND